VIQAFDPQPVRGSKVFPATSDATGPRTVTVQFDPSPRTFDKGAGRPGWAGVVGVGLGTALLASVLTAGVVTTSNDRPASAPVASSPEAAPLVRANSAAPNWTAVAAAVRPSVVAVKLQTSDGNGDEGSGVVLDRSGKILTNNHVVAAVGTGDTLTITLADGRIYPATVLGTDQSTDLAVLQIKKPPSGLRAATFANSTAVKVGDPVMAIGNPLGLSDTVTTGIVSALNRPVTTSAESRPTTPFDPGQSQSSPVVTDAIQTDAAINPGNSGGALVDAKGHVIGITSSIASLGSAFGGESGNIGLGFAIPSNETRYVADQLVHHGTVKHAYLGVSVSDGMVSSGDAQRAAAVVGKVTSGTPAASAGLRAGDGIIALNGSALDGADSLVAQVHALAPGTKVALTLVRGGHESTVHLTVAARPTDTAG